MRYAPELADGPWPCYVIEFDELVAIAATQGVGVASDGVPVEPQLAVVESLLETLNNQ